MTSGDDKKSLLEMHWRERYEYEAQRQAVALDKLNEQELLEKIQRGQIDSYFAIWRAIGVKGTIENAAMVLLSHLQRSPGDNQMLHRFHCSAALFKILGMPDRASDNPLRKQVQWDHQGEEARQEVLLTLRSIIDERLKGDEENPPD